ncbi:hypothetical protein [Niallia taxi]|uniref:hypothetical protein n=1 Tax=Niallia taxi TaxID=2499688 RepID=UPI0011A78F53|nr:hypothetical protein [Niallia taxi]MCM3213611.1 hypothetical protein [Niallia taxi]
MKIFVLFFIIILISIAFSFVIDFMMAIKLSIAMQNLKKPFLVMTYPKYLIGFAFLLTFVLPPIYIYLKKRKYTRKA